MVFCRSLSCAKWSAEARLASRAQRLFISVAPKAFGVSAALRWDAGGTPATTDAGNAMDGSQRLAVLRFFLGFDHSHEPFLDSVRGLRRTQAQRECFV